jgi:hypothetical protein
MKELKNDLLTSKYTEVFHEEPEDMEYNAPHNFEVRMVPMSEGASQPILAKIHFQEGPIKECGINGACNEDLIAMVITRLEYFQKTKFVCRENAIAITKLEESLMWLGKRTIDREKIGVEGTIEV